MHCPSIEPLEPRLLLVIAGTRPAPDLLDEAILFRLPLATDTTTHFYFDRNGSAAGSLAWNGTSQSYDGHTGSDYSGGPRGKSVFAAAPGVIVAKVDGFGDQEGTANGNYIKLNHGNDRSGKPINTFYLHLNAGSLTTKVIGDTLAAGEYVGGVGTSGNSTGLHLHFHVSYGTAALDPYAASGETSWWYSQGPPPSTTAAPSKFAVGEYVQVFSLGSGGTLSVRSPNPTSSSIGTQVDGAIGQVLTAPVLSTTDGDINNNLYNRYKVHFTNGMEGWVAQNWLRDAPPSVPTSPTPAHNAVLTNTPAILDWADSTAATSYDVYLDGVFKQNVTISQYTVSGSLASGSHSWQVIAKNSSSSTNGPTWTFAINPIPPSAPSTPTPANNAILNVAPATLDWADSTSTSSYDVYVDSVFKQNVTSSSYAPGSLANGNHTWQIVAVGAGGSVSGPLWSFTLDTVRPTALLGSERPTPGSSSFQFTVTYTDATTGIDISTLDSSDIKVTGPNSYSAFAAFVSVDIPSNGSPRIVTYSIPAPSAGGATWSLADSGNYLFTQQTNQVRDLAGNFKTSGILASMLIEIPFAYVVDDDDTLVIEGDGSGSPITLSTSGSNLTAAQAAIMLPFDPSTFSTIDVIGTGGSIPFSFAAAIAHPVTFAAGAFTFAADAGAYAPAKLQSGASASLIFNTTQHLTSLTLDATGRASLSPGANKSIVTAALSITSGARLDIADNALILDYADTDPSPLAAIKSHIATGRGGTDFGFATWNGIGINSSTAAAQDGVSFAIGYTENSFLPLLGLPSYTSFFGQGVDSSALLIRYTKGADANLDGIVNTDDVTIVGALYNSTGTGDWFLGDFDYDGIVDTDDVTVLGALYAP